MDDQKFEEALDRQMIITTYRQCFSRWRVGGPFRLAPTLKEHALAYFKPVPNFDENMRRIHPPDVAEKVIASYGRILKACSSFVSDLTDEQFHKYMRDFERQHVVMN